MSIEEWAAVIGVILSVVMALGPWMFAVHAKLAVIASQIDGLCTKVEDLSASHEERLAMCIDHQSRLERYDLRLSDLAERLQAME